MSADRGEFPPESEHVLDWVWGFVPMPKLTTDRGNRDRKREVHGMTCRCFICPTRAGENAVRRPKHGTQKPRGRRRRG